MSSRASGSQRSAPLHDSTNAMSNKVLTPEQIQLLELAKKMGLNIGIGNMNQVCTDGFVHRTQC